MSLRMVQGEGKTSNGTEGKADEDEEHEEDRDMRPEDGFHGRALFEEPACSWHPFCSFASVRDDAEMRKAGL